MLWKVKLAVKILSGKIAPLKFILTKIGFFRHGKMDSMEYAISVLNLHLNRVWDPHPAPADEGHPPPEVKPPQALLPLKSGGGTCLEIGPGESLMTMILARAAGFERTLLVDYGWQINDDIQCYVEAANFLRENGSNVPGIFPKDRIEDVMAKYSSEYLVGGIDSMRQIQERSIEFSFSQAVFEHIPKNQVREYLRQLKRVGKPLGVSSHVIDLKDHLGGSINQLRFPESRWETPSVYNSGIYTNRLRFSQWLKLFEEEGLEYDVIEKKEFPALPIKRNQLSEEFKELPEQDLLVSGFGVVFRWK